MSSEPKGSPNDLRDWLRDDIAEIARVAAILGAITAAAIMFLPDDLMNNGLALIILIIAGPVYLFMSDMPKRTPLLWRNIVAVFSFSILYAFSYFLLIHFLRGAVHLMALAYGSPALAHLTKVQASDGTALALLGFSALMSLVLMPINLWQAVGARPRHVSSPVIIPTRPRTWPIDRPDMLTPDNVDAFLRRFHFHDGEILSIHVGYEALSTAPPLRLVLLLSTREITEDGEYWVLLRGTCDEVAEYRLTHLPNVMNDIFGLEPHIAFFDGITYLNLEPDDFTWKGVEDFRRSPLMVAASTHTWEMVPFPE
jgi:hypothetical protein